MRVAPLLLLPVLTGCLDYERIVLTMDARRGAQTVVSELRSEGMHHKQVKGCADVASCRAQLREVACDEIDEGAQPADLARVDLREDGTVDLVSTTTRTWGELEAKALADGGLAAVWEARAGKEEERRPTFAFVSDEEILKVAVVRGRFDHLAHHLEQGKDLDTWLLRSRRGTLRITAELRDAADQPTPDAELRWVAKVPGLAEALRATPVSCTGAEAAREPKEG